MSKHSADENDWAKMPPIDFRTPLKASDRSWLTKHPGMRPPPTPILWDAWTAYRQPYWRRVWDALRGR